MKNVGVERQLSHLWKVHHFVRLFFFPNILQERKLLLMHSLPDYSLDSPGKYHFDKCFKAWHHRPPTSFSESPLTDHPTSK